MPAVTPVSLTDKAVPSNSAPVPVAPQVRSVESVPAGGSVPVSSQMKDAKEVSSPVTAVAAGQRASVANGPKNPWAAYMALVRSLIERKKFYPPLARRAGMEGTVILRVILDRNGAIRSKAVIRSSGRSLLDNAGLQTVSAIDTFPPVPKDIGGDDVTLEVPVTYRLGGH
jgi:protein TonB